MNGQPRHFVMQAWKAQLDSGLRAIEALIEGATQMHEAQLEAATAAHAAGRDEEKRSGPKG